MSFAIIDTIISQLVTNKFDLSKFEELYNMILVNTVNVIQMMHKSGKSMLEIDDEIGIHNIGAHVLQLELDQYLDPTVNIIPILRTNLTFCNIPDPEYLIACFQAQTSLTEESILSIWNTALKSK